MLLLTWHNFTMRNIQEFMTTARGRIRCRRCTATSSRTGKQCAKPALKSSRTQKCGHHGGASPGPRTAGGKARIAAVHLKHGNATNAVRAAYSAASARISRLEDAMYVLGMSSMPRLRGRKATGYVPIRSIDQVRQMILDDALHLDRGVTRGPENI